MNTHIQPKTTRILILAFIIFSLLACSTGEQEFFETEMSMAGKTLVSVAKTEVVDTGKTVVSSAKTQVMDEGKTVVAGGVDLVSTKVAQLKETALAGVSNVLPDVEKKEVIDYFALGDSIASGHGLDDDGSDCKRSEHAYPDKVRDYLLKRYEKVNFKHPACSGATVKEPDTSVIEKDSNKWFHNQVEEVLSNLTDRPTLVTITIGANDIGWLDPLVLGEHAKQVGDKYLKWVEDKEAEISNGLIVEIQRLITGHPNVSL